MNGTKKWHKANGPAFAPGEEWVSVDGAEHQRKIVSVRKFGNGKWDYEVTYKSLTTDMEWTKDAWNFQVRYQHIADRDI